MGHRRLHQFGAFAQILGDHVCDVVDDVAIVAKPARERVGTRSAIENVVAAIAGYGVGKAVTRAVDGSGSRQREVFNISAECIRHRRLHCISAFAGIFGDNIAHVVNDVGIVAETAGQRVSACATVENVIGAIADNGVGKAVARAIDGNGPREREVFDICAERVGHRCLHHVGAFAQILGDDIGDVVDDVGVVAETANKSVGTRSSIESVGL